MGRRTGLLLGCALVLLGAGARAADDAQGLPGLDRELHQPPAAAGDSDAANRADGSAARPAVSAVPKQPNATSRGFRLPAQRTGDDIDRDLQSATWPADIMRLADECLQQPNAKGCEFRALQLKRAARQPELILQSKDVHLQKDAFTDPQLPVELRGDVRRAALGEAQAAVHLAQYYHGGGVERPALDAYRYEGWLQYASLLGDAPAAYELALHFRELGQPQLAALYEERALGLGYVPPASLGHDRK